MESCRFAIFAVAIFLLSCFAILLCSPGIPGRESNLLCTRHRHGPALNSSHVLHKDLIPPPPTKVHDTSIMATFPALPAY